MDNLVYNAVAPWKGYLHWLGNIREGTSKSGNEYAFADFTLRYTDSKMQEKYITFSAGNVDIVKLLKGAGIGTPLKVQWVPDTKEDPQRDRWFPSFVAYNVSVIRNEGPQKLAEPAPAEQKLRHEGIPAQTDDDSDLPF